MELGQVFALLGAIIRPGLVSKDLSVEDSLEESEVFDMDMHWRFSLSDLGTDLDRVMKRTDGQIPEHCHQALLVALALLKLL